MYITRKKNESGTHDLRKRTRHFYNEAEDQVVMLLICQLINCGVAAKKFYDRSLRVPITIISSCLIPYWMKKMFVTHTIDHHIISIIFLQISPSLIIDQMLGIYINIGFA